MTRGHTPPDTLTAEDILSLREIRRDIWTNGAIGFFGGGAIGYLLHRGAVAARDRKYFHASLNRNTAFASCMLGAALGSFVLSTTAGKNSVHNIHHVFERGAQPLAVEKDGDKERYSKIVTGAKARNEENVDRGELERNRILRRATLSRKFKEGQGLNDSHGGHWVEDKFRKE